MDLGIYFPSNLDTAFRKVTMSQIMVSFLSAKEIYAVADVQLNLLWVKSREVDPRFFSLQANELPEVPSTEYVNTYQHFLRHPYIPTEKVKQAFGSIIEPDENNYRTFYLIVLQEVFLPYLDVSEGRNWMIKSVRTAGLSFPPYSYSGTLPVPFRGVLLLPI